jgi:uncharacterized protein
MYQADILNGEEGSELLRVARNTLERFLRKEHVAKPEHYSDKLNAVFGVYCELLKNGQSLGSAVVGLPFPLTTIIDSAMAAVTAAAEHCSLKPSDLAELRIELTILTEPELLEVMMPAEKYLKSIVPNADGIMLKYGVYESFLPPQAWAGVEDKEKFMETLCEKAGLSDGMWKEEGIEIYKFHVQLLKE